MLYFDYFNVIIKLLLWSGISFTLALIFISIIFIRITVPRFRIETLSRLGWSTLLSILALVFCVYFLGVFLA